MRNLRKSKKEYKLHKCTGYNLVVIELPSGKELYLEESNVKKDGSTELKIHIQDTDWDSLTVKKKQVENAVTLVLGYDFSSLDDLKEELNVK